MCLCIQIWLNVGGKKGMCPDLAKYWSRWGGGCTDLTGVNPKLYTPPLPQPIPYIHTTPPPYIHSTDS